MATSKANECSSDLNIPPELDFKSEKFDPVKALSTDNIHLPFPKAKTYDNLAQYYNHTFNVKAKKQAATNEKKAEKQEIKRDYSFYYKTLGISDEAYEPHQESDPTEEERHSSNKKSKRRKK